MPGDRSPRALRLAATGGVVVLVRLLLWATRLARTRAVLDRLATLRLPVVPEPPPSTVARVSRVARWVPGASCLTRALSARLLLAWSGTEAVVCFGARRDRGRLVAHAWVEVAGEALDPSASDYQRLRATGPGDG